ncbi:hypothetical protein [Nostoc sp.]
MAAPEGWLLLRLPQGLGGRRQKVVPMKRVSKALYENVLSKSAQ